MVWINTITMNVDQIYDHLSRRQLTHSYRAMSREWFGAADNYACCLGVGGTPSDRVLIYKGGVDDSFRRINPMIDPNIARWRDSDFAVERMTELSRNGSMPEGYLDAYVLYLGRIMAVQQSQPAPGTDGANRVDSYR
jgi:hypothetical protein